MSKHNAFTSNNSSFFAANPLLQRCLMKFLNQISHPQHTRFYSAETAQINHESSRYVIQKFRRFVGYTAFYCFTSVLIYAYTNNTTRAGISRADQFYAAYPAGTELLVDSSKLYKAALGNCFEVEEWGPIEYCVMAKHFERQGKSPYAYHAEADPTLDDLMTSKEEGLSGREEGWLMIVKGRKHSKIERRRHINGPGEMGLNKELEASKPLEGVQRTSEDLMGRVICSPNHMASGPLAEMNEECNSPLDYLSPDEGGL
ncbi:hypothetical protein RJ641_002827 [Dillenia turbinata]|uniref:Uncharacterized protein n=1 Tax=Dillenia turbinata TaxID=194707 RepID=A0AAN8Z8X1_9MAGN